MKLFLFEKSMREGVDTMYRPHDVEVADLFGIVLAMPEVPLDTPVEMRTELIEFGSLEDLA